MSSATSAKSSFTTGLNTSSGTTLESVSYQETVVERRAISEEPTEAVEAAQVPSSTSETQLSQDGVNYVSMYAKDEVSVGRSVLDTLVSRGTLEDISCTEPSEANLGSLSQIELSVSNSQEKPDAVSEWKRIQGVMARAVPLCHGHKEPCVARVVKKEGPTKGRGFYVCARAQGPSSNPEARCDHFEWSTSRMKSKGKVPGK
ncbi:hypothetical protein R1sor_000635 [Riccia sorocarpa]|uniref:GRF-type domain-containing protein n=1 Tax=Riccia sorocarpa TaxID=122646 RepID=A0ABD3GUI4_9MARC